MEQSLLDGDIEDPPPEYTERGKHKSEYSPRHMLNTLLTQLCRYEILDQVKDYHHSRRGFPRYSWINRRGSTRYSQEEADAFPPLWTCLSLECRVLFDGLRSYI